jgi:hypothetical protein
VLKLDMEEKKYGFLKILGILGATILIIFGSMDNIWRTMKLAWNKLVKE